uniref:Glutathione peroxidase 4 n=1 Tax=Ailuropoda melanoleuca TaxID=9646 RepID=A0A7N5P2P7_AILME
MSLRCFASKTLLCGFLVGRGLTRVMCAQKSDWQSAKSIYDFHALDIDGNNVSLEKYRGMVCIITNVATQ